MGLALILLVALVIVVIAARWLSSSSRKRIRDATSRHDEVHQKIKAIEARVVDSKTQLDKNLVSLRRQDFDAFISTTPIRHLKQYGASNVRWSALESAGISTLAGFASLRADVMAIDGVGGVSAARLREAFDGLEREWRAKSTRIPRVLQTPTERATARSSLVRLFYTREFVPAFEALVEGLELTPPPCTLWSIFSNAGDIPYSEEQFDALDTMARAWHEQIRVLEESEREALEDIDEHLEARWDEKLSSRVASPGEGGRAGSPGVRWAYETEARFEEEFLEPLIRRWGFSTHAQYPIEVKLGSSNTLLYVDQYLLDEDGPVILIESKREIINARQLDEAMAQARSYALQLGFPAFIVASPQGFWLYKLTLNQEELVAHEADMDALVKGAEGWRELVLDHRKPHM